MSSIPEVLGDRYEVGEVLGRGGMAEVHRATDTRLGRDVAVKMLRADLSRDPGFQARFRREAQSAATLNHPAIVAVYDTGEDVVPDGVLPYIVMELVTGSTLRDLLLSGRRLLPERALEIISGVLAALDHSHRHGIVHRDIKPANVMLTPRGEVKVMDFGIARSVAAATSAMTQTSAVIGTAQYLSPEQASGEEVDARTDLYSTGCVLFELLTGRAPFVGDSPISVAYQHVRELPPAPSSLDPQISPEIDAVVLKALAKDPADRYQNAALMRADVDRARTGQPVQAEIVPAQRTQVFAPVPRTPAVVTMRAVPEVEPALVLPELPPKSHAGGYFLLILALLAVVAAAGFGITKLLASPAKVVVPSVVNKTLLAAQAEIQKSGLDSTVAADHVPSDTIPADSVVSTTPGAGEKVEKNATVTLTLSAGRKKVAVPDVTKESCADATEELKGVGLTHVTCNAVSSDQPENEVLSSEPPALQEVDPGQNIVLTVSNGKLPVPDLKDLSKAQAEFKLKQEGFRPSLGYRQLDPNNPDDVVRVGMVVDQVPAPGEELKQGGTVQFFIGQLPTPTEQPTQPPGGATDVPVPDPNATATGG